MKDHAQSELLDCILDQLESDSSWNKEDMFEKAYSMMGYKRYRLNKQMLDTMTKETYDTDKITGQKDIGKQKHAGVLENAGEPDTAEVKIEMEHEFIKQASDNLVSLNNKKMLACVGEFKSLSAMMHFKENCADKKHTMRTSPKPWKFWTNWKGRSCIFGLSWPVTRCRRCARTSAVNSFTRLWF